MSEYRMIKKLGSGVFGDVNLWEKTYNCQKIVIKTIKIDRENDVYKILKNEMMAIKRKHHPNIIKHYNSYFRECLYLIEMEYAHQGNLRDCIDARRPNNFLKIQRIKNIFVQILLGLAEIHRRKLVHRDLQPKNIFLTDINGDIVKIGNFGVTKLLVNFDSVNENERQRNYWAPELFDHKEFTEKSDIWAAGCILFELITLDTQFTEAENTTGNNKDMLKFLSAKKYGTIFPHILNQMLNANPKPRSTAEDLLSREYLTADVVAAKFSYGSC